MKHIALVLALLMVVTSANAALTTTIKGIQEGEDLWRSDIVVNDIQDAKFAHNMADMSPRDSTSGQSGLVVGPETAWGDNGHYTSILGVIDLFNLLPNSTVTGPDDILSATLRVRQGSPSGGEIIGYHAITSPWMLAGTEDDVTALRRVGGGEDPWWVADIGKTPGTDASGNPDYTGFVGFTAADYDGGSGGQFTITDTTTRGDNDMDITQIVKDWLAGGEESNQGIAMVWEYQGEWTPIDAPYFKASDSGASWDKLPDGSHPGPEFIITYAPEPVTIGLLAVGGLALLRRRRR